jgi:hypothetical protein
MVFDPNAAKYDFPPAQSDAAAARELEQAIAATPKYHSGPVELQTKPENVERLGDYYEWVGLDRAEARKVPKAT